MSVRIWALRQISGGYGRLAPGDSAAMDDRTAEALEARGLVSRTPPKAKGPHENKTIVPGENKAAVDDSVVSRDDAVAAVPESVTSDTRAESSATPKKPRKPRTK